MAYKVLSIKRSPHAAILIDNGVPPRTIAVRLRNTIDMIFILILLKSKKIKQSVHSLIDKLGLIDLG